jgi:hypothetical protein
MPPEFDQKPAPVPKRDASCTLCFKIVFVTRAGQLRRHKNQSGAICRGEPFNVQPVARGLVQLTLIVKGGGQ